MNEFAIFAICGLLVIIASFISIWTYDEASQQMMADTWPWHLPM